MAAGGNVEIGCVLAAAGAPGASDHELYQGLLADCALFRELGFGTVWVLEHHFSDYFPAPDPAVQISHLAGRFPELGYPIMIDCIVADTDDEAVREACRYKPRFMQAQIDHYAPHATNWAGTPGYQAWQRIFAGLEQRTRPENIVPWCEWQLIGSAPTVRRKLQRYLDIGFNHIILHFSTPGIPVDVRRGWAARFAADVAPHFRPPAATLPAADPSAGTAAGRPAVGETVR